MRKFLIMALLASAAALYSAPNADAAFAIRYSQNGGAFVTINDNQAGLDLNPAVDFIAINIPGLGTFVGGGSNGFTVEGAFVTLMDLQGNGAWVDAVGTESLVIDLSRSDIDTGPAPLTLTHNFTGSIVGIGSGTVTEQWWVNDANGLFALTAPTSGPLAPGGGPTSTEINVTAPYSVTLRISATNITGTVSLSADNNVAIVVPGPSALVLLIGALPGAGVMYLRRRKKA